MRKFFYILISLLILFNLTSCSNINMESGSVSFQFPEEVASIIKAGGDSVPVSGDGGEGAHSSSSGNLVYTCRVIVFGDYSTSSSQDYSSLDNLMGSDISISGIPVDSVVRLRVMIELGGNVIYEGISGAIKVEEKKNEVTVLLASKEPGGAGGGSEGRYKDARIGDIILADGTICSPDDYDGTTMIPAAVIFSAKTDERPALGIGIPYYDSYGTAEYYTYGSSIYWGPISGATYPSFLGTKDSGYMNGKNQLELAQQWLEGKSYSLSEFPPFYYASTFGTKQRNIFTDGWYVPTCAEIDQIRLNNEANGDVVDSLQKISNKLNFGTNGFWTANYCATSTGDGLSQAYYYSFAFESITPTNLHNTNTSATYNILVIREFR